LKKEGTTMNNTGFSLMVALGLGLAIGCGGAPPPAAADATQTGSAAAPAAGDTDGDGIPDSADKCPTQKEDGQAPDPKDGCPKA
jgi:OOP family OmpA-OmpF porin